MSKAYPLAWPPGWPRTDKFKRQRSRFKVTVASALAFLDEEVRRLGAKNLVISSNYTLGVSNPTDPGVCAYFTYEEAPAAIPCDRWLKIEDNVHAVAKTIEAMRGIERWGAKHMVKAAFAGFAALPSPGTGSWTWRECLGFTATAKVTLPQVERTYRTLRSAAHPDKGGTPAQFELIQRAWEMAQQELR